MIFNYINIKSENRIDYRTIKLDLSSSSLTTFSFSNNINIENNLYNNDIKIQILNLPSSSDTYISIKSFKLNSFISNNDILNIDDSLIIDTSYSLMGEYIIEFIIFVPKTEVEKEKYGNYQENDLNEQYIYFTKDKFKLILSLTSCSSTKYS